jgi:transcriptional antiterminator RfaH
VTIATDKRWYVVQTHPRSEVRANEHLARQGFDVYLPRYQRRRRHARKVDVVAAPLFPGYLFVAVDIARQRWRCIRSTVGVRHLICHGNDPVPISAVIVEDLRAREGEAGLIRLPMRPPCAPGEKLRVLDGVFSACLGLYDGMTDGERVAVLLDMLGRKVRVLLDYDSVAAA